MRKVIQKRPFSALILMVLVAAMVLSFAACGDSAETSTPASAQTPSGEVTSIGEGDKSFTLEVHDPDGNVTVFQVNTDAQFVGEALLENGLVEGEDSQYGLFIHVVNGIAVDFNKDGLYWAFYENNQYAVSGVDTTEIDESVVYSLKAQK